MEGNRGIGGLHGRPDEEMFLNRPAAVEPDTPTVGPLRINKVTSPTSPLQQPTASTSGPTVPTQQLPARTYTPPTIKPSSTMPPYPVDNGPTHAAARPTYTPPISGGDRTKSSTPESGRRPMGGSPRTRFDASDPNRPSVAGYAQPSRSDGRTASPAGAPDPRYKQSGQVEEGLFQKPPEGRANTMPQKKDEPAVNPFPEYHQQYWPPPSGAATSSTPPNSNGPSNLNIQKPAGTGLNRFDSTASVATTRAQRGSPPPPETPIVGPPLPGSGIEARFAATGLAAPTGTGAPSAAASQRMAQYGAPPTRPVYTPPAQQGTLAPASKPPARPWTPTEQPGSQPHGPPMVYQGVTEVNEPAAVPTTGPPNVPSAVPSAAPAPAPIPGAQRPEHPLEHDFHRLGVSDEPPPAYSTVQPHPPGQGYPQEKQRPAPLQPASLTSPGGSQPAAPAAGYGTPQGHPAFANDPRLQQPGGGSPAQSLAGSTLPLSGPSQMGAGPSSPPPLPEGWIAHLDPNSGHYYYIHLATQSTQWEFPKGPTPLNLNEPMSPTGTFINPLTSPAASSFSKPLASPGFGPVPQSATMRPDGFMSMSSMSSPTAAGFTGPPPSAGVDVYKVAPTNGVYFGPYLRYTNMDVERGVWMGSILLVTDAGQPPTIHIHQSTDLSPNPRQLKPNPIYSHQRWMFFRYDVDLKMEEQGAKWTYAITSHLGCTRYEFLVAGRYDTSWRFIAHSGNDFGLNVSTAERTKLGGVGYMWKDVLTRHIECNGFHAQLGLGDQVFADRMWKELPLLKQWTAMSGKDNRRNAPWTPRHEEDVTHAYFHYYTSHFDQPHLREAFAQIPHILTLDDHDIFDGFGSYPEYMQFSNMFKNIGRIGIEMYLLFQHHTTLDILRNVQDDTDLFTITGTGWHFIKYLGPAVVVVGPDTRSERNPHQVMAGPTYQGLFPKIAMLPPSVQHCIWMLPVPVVYPRMESMETLASTVATGKKAMNTTFNVLGRVTSSVAGVVGAKGVVGEGFNSVKKAVGKSGLMSGILSPFGDIDMLDELRDQWTHESKDLERTYLIRTLQGIAHNKSLRMTFLSGDVGACGAGLVHDPAHPQDHKTMYQIVTSPIVNGPTGNYVMRLLHSNKPLYVPANGHRSLHTPSDTKEDMMEIFSADVNGQPRELRRLMPRRNYVACVAFDPDVVGGSFAAQSPAPSLDGQPGGPGGKLSLAVDFMVQGEAVFAGAGAPGAVKYGPVVIPNLEYGR